MTSHVAAPTIVRARVLIDQEYRRLDGTWLRRDDLIEGDTSDDAELRWLRALVSRSPAAIEVLEGEIPDELMEAEAEPVMAAAPDPGPFADLPSRDLRKRLLIHDEDAQRRRERLAESQAQERAAKRALGQKAGANGDAPKLEKALTDAQANVNAKRAALDAFLEETAEERSQLEAALAIAEHRDAEKALEPLLAQFEAARDTYIRGLISVANLRLDVFDARTRYAAAADRLGKRGGRWIPDVVEVESPFHRNRESLEAIGFDVRHDKRGRWTVKDAR